MKNIISRRVANTDNFILITKRGITFWGRDIVPKEILITEDIRGLIKRLNLPYNEVLEIEDDNTFCFLENLYKF